MGATIIAWIKSEQSITHIRRLQQEILIDTAKAAFITMLIAVFLIAISLKKVVYQIKQARNFATRLPLNEFEILQTKPTSSEIEGLISALNSTSKQLYNQNNELQMLNALINYSNDPVFIIDPDDDFKMIFANEAACRHFSMPLDKLLTLHVPDWSLDFDLIRMEKLWHDLSINKHQLFESQHKIDNVIVPVEISANYLEYRDKKYAAGYFRNITDRKRTEEEIKLSALVFDNSNEGMLITNSEGLILSTNPAFTKITGYTKEEIIGQNPRILNSGKQDNKFYQKMWQQITTHGTWQGEIWNRHKNGNTYAEWLSINSTFNSDGSIKNHVAIFTDITEKKRSEKLIWQQANFDSLTGLPNRQMFHDRLQQNIKLAQRNSYSLVLMFLDLDRFKEVNDSLGHDMGDILLIEVAKRLTECVRITDTVARLGGDEFTIILLQPESDDNIDTIAEHILNKLQQAFKLKQDTAFISASIGISVYPDDADNKETLISCADQAMYESKNQGRDCYHYFKQSMQETSQARRLLTNDLREALNKNQFKIVYQPIVDLLTGKIIKAEALLRWQHPQKGFISPAEFIPIAEECGAILPIGEWVFHQVVAQAKCWRSELHPNFQISINKSPVQFHHENNNSCEWFNYLSEHNLPGQAIVVEITEGLLLEQEIAEDLLNYRDANIQVALDDFGTGYSSLAYLTRFDIDYLKIDRSFVSHLSADSNNLKLCEAIIAMAHTLDIKVIAEGIETEEQYELLTQSGCDYGQGYLLGKPMAPENFLN